MIEQIIVGLSGPFCEHTSDPSRIAVIWLTPEAKAKPGILVRCVVCGAKIFIRPGTELPTIVSLANDKLTADLEKEAIKSQARKKPSDKKAKPIPPTGKTEGSLNTPFAVQHSHGTEFTDADKKFLRSLKISCD